MIRYLKAADYMPDLEPAQPYIPDEDRTRAAAEPPQPVPFHCKPWVDGQKLGWTLRYPYLTPVTIVGLPDGEVRIENGAELDRESQMTTTVRPFGDGRYWGIPGTGYTVTTPNGIVSLTLPANDPPPGLRLVSGIVETDWYPLETPLVFQVPPAGESIILDRGCELARIVPLPRAAGETAVLLDEAAAADLLERRAAYQAAYDATPGTRLATGGYLKRVYNAWSKAHRSE